MRRPSGRAATRRPFGDGPLGSWQPAPSSSAYTSCCTRGVRAPRAAVWVPQVNVINKTNLSMDSNQHACAWQHGCLHDNPFSPSRHAALQAPAACNGHLLPHMLAVCLCLAGMRLGGTLMT